MSLVSMAIDGVKKDLKKIDKNKNGKPDVIEALDKAEAALEKVEKYASKVQPAHVVALLTVANRTVHPPIFSEEELKDFAEGICQIDEAAAVIKAALETIESNLVK